MALSSDIMSKKLRLWRTIAIILGLTTMLLITVIVYTHKGYILNAIHKTNRPLPCEKEIAALFSQIIYSGLPTIVSQPFSIDVDFEKKTWCAHNLNSFDANGNILLREGKYGLCDQLATYVFDRIAPLLPDIYKIYFVRRKVR